MKGPRTHPALEGGGAAHIHYEGCGSHLLVGRTVPTIRGRVDALFVVFEAVGPVVPHAIVIEIK